MGSRRKTVALLRVARSLYAGGQSVGEIAEALGVSADAIRRWRREDQTDWTARRQEAASRDPASLARDLESLLADIVSDGTMGLAARADAATKVAGSLERLRDRLDDPGRDLDVIARITAFAASRFSAEQLHTWDLILTAYCDQELGRAKWLAEGGR